MSRIKSRDTKPELRLRRALWALGLRYRLGASVVGRHGCPRHGVMPKNNRDFWRKKIGGNVERDRRVNDLLRAAGWGVLRFWEHDVDSDLQNVLSAVAAAVPPK
jgi:DNA mismatch endonuclease (patch repair protein)